MADGKERKALAISQSNAVKGFLFHSSVPKHLPIHPDPGRSHVRVDFQPIELPCQPLAQAQELADRGSTTGSRDLRVRLSQESVHLWRVGDLPAEAPAR